LRNVENNTTLLSARKSAVYLREEEKKILNLCALVVPVIHKLCKLLKESKIYGKLAEVV
jgi:hypothetical protein